MKIDSRGKQEKRIERVCEYIYQNLDSEFTVDKLGQVAQLSKFHFHRVFTAWTGVSVSRFIQLARLRRASFQLAFEQEVKIIDIALAAGFESPEAFSRAFKRTFQQSPSQFRTAPEWPLWHSTFQFTLPEKGSTNMQVDIVNFEETRVALIEHRGAPETVYDTAAQFIAWRKASGLSPIKTSRTFGIPYSDPKTTRPAEFRFDICGSINAEVPENPWGVRAGHIPGGRCAVLRHKGSHDNMDKSIYHLYREWLPHNDEAWRDFPCFFHYLNFVHQVPENDLLTDIYLPIV